MNSFQCHGKLVDDAAKVLVNTSSGETTLVKFMLMDPGKPYQKSDPSVFEVHCVKEFADHIFENLKKDKEVIVYGCMKQKNFTTTFGVKQSKYYVAADNITLLPLFR